MCRLICFETNPRARSHSCKSRGFQHLLKAFGGFAHFHGMSTASSFFLKIDIMLKGVLLIVFPTTKPDLVTEISTENNSMFNSRNTFRTVFVVQSAKKVFCFHLNKRLSFAILRYVLPILLRFHGLWIFKCRVEPLLMVLCVWLTFSCE